MLIKNLRGVKKLIFLAAYTISSSNSSRISKSDLSFLFLRNEIILRWTVQKQRASKQEEKKKNINIIGAERKTTFSAKFTSFIKNSHICVLLSEFCLFNKMWVFLKICFRGLVKSVSTSCLNFLLLFPRSLNFLLHFWSCFASV